MLPIVKLRNVRRPESWDCNPSSSFPFSLLAVMNKRTSHTGDTPTFHQLLSMKGVDGKPLNVIRRITVNYYTFGVILLQDDNGEKVDVIERDHKEAEAITREILKKWLRDGGPRCTYPHLMDCLRKSELGALADSIAHEIVSHCRSY